MSKRVRQSVSERVSERVRQSVSERVRTECE